MPAVIITVVGGTILTPILLKLAFRGKTESQMVVSQLADRYEKESQLDIVAERLVQEDRDMMRKDVKNSKK